MEFMLVDSASNSWVGGGLMGISNAAYTHGIEGSKSLTGELTTIRITTVGGSETFVAGSINIQYENPNPTVVAENRAGLVVQKVFSQDGEFATGSTTMVDDDSIPQNDEGSEFMTATITPTNANNILEIEVSFMCGTGAVENPIMALYQDDTADALASVFFRNDAVNVASTNHLRHHMTAGTTSSTTFKIRVGPTNAGTITFNGTAGGRKCGGVMASSISITEYEA
jgi:hypothetical protein